jgi:hypothetical protein
VGYPKFIRLGGSNTTEIQTRVHYEHKLHVAYEYKKCIITDRTKSDWLRIRESDNFSFLEPDMFPFCFFRE